MKLGRIYVGNKEGLREPLEKRHIDGHKQEKSEFANSKSSLLGQSKAGSSEGWSEQYWAE